MRSESLGVVALLAACAPKGAGTAHPSPNAAPVTAIVNATVIPMDTERLIRNAAVVIRGDRIVWVGPGSRRSMRSPPRRGTRGSSWAATGSVRSCRARERTSSSLPTILSLTWPDCGSRGR